MAPAFELAQRNALSARCAVRSGSPVEARDATNLKDAVRETPGNRLFKYKDSVTRRLRPLSFPFHPGGGNRAGGIGARLSLASLSPPLAERPRDPQHGATPRPYFTIVHI
jgi:hypothetical protein